MSERWSKSIRSGSYTQKCQRFAATAGAQPLCSEAHTRRLGLASVGMATNIGTSLPFEVVAIELGHLQRPQGHADLVLDHQLGEPRAVDQHNPFHRSREVKCLGAEGGGRDED